MRVIEFDQYGGPEVLVVRERPVPVPGAGQVLVAVHASTVNPADGLTRAGVLAPMTGHLRFPFVPGWDLAGEVVTGAAGLEVGQRVAGTVAWFESGRGTYVERLAVDAGSLASIPDTVDDVTAAAVGINALTAAQALEILGLSAGQTLLVTGASGAVGGYAVQLATAAGVRVLAVGSAGDDDWVRGLGAAELVARGATADVVAAVRASAPAGVDAALDAVPVGPDLIGAVRDGGAFLTVLDMTMPAPERGIRVEKVGVHPDGAQLGALLAAVAAGTLTVRIAGRLPLADAAAAHERVSAGGLRGKLVLTM